jgi:hypothetical protein
MGKEEKGEGYNSIGSTNPMVFFHCLSLFLVFVIYDCEIILKRSGLKQFPFYSPNGFCGFTGLF